MSKFNVYLLIACMSILSCQGKPTRSLSKRMLPNLPGEEMTSIARQLTEELHPHMFEIPELFSSELNALHGELATPVGQRPFADRQVSIFLSPDHILCRI